MRGDVGDSYERMRRILSKMRYRGNVDATRACAGAAEELLPLLHHAMLVYSGDIARLIASSGYDLLGKNDLRFVETVWRAVGDIFDYRPAVSAKQFLARGFAERKLDTLADIFKLVYEKKQRIAPETKARRASLLQQTKPTETHIVRDVYDDKGHDHVVVQRTPLPNPEPKPVFRQPQSAVNDKKIEALEVCFCFVVEFTSSSRLMGMCVFRLHLESKPKPSRI